MKALWLFWNPPAAFWQWCTTAASQGRFGEIDIFLLFCFVSIKLWCFFFFFNCFTTIELWRICVLCSHLRYDTLAQMLTLANVHARSKVLVFETCAGLVLGSVMERMGGVEKATLSTFLSVWPAAAFFLFLPHQHFFLYNCPPFPLCAGYGSVIQMYPGEEPIRAGMESFGFPAHFHDTLHEFPICRINALLAGTLDTAAKALSAGRTCLFYFNRQLPSNIFCALLHCLLGLKFGSII